MVFSSVRPVLRQFPAAWLAGVLVTALFSIGTGAFALTNGDLPTRAGWAGAVFFVPSLALALGVFTSSGKTFELVYVLLWYMSPLQKALGMQFGFSLRVVDYDDLTVGLSRKERLEGSMGETCLAAIREWSRFAEKLVTSLACLEPACFI